MWKRWLRAGQRIALPAAEERAVYVAEGALKARQTQIPSMRWRCSQTCPGWCSEATADARIAIVGGERLGARFIDWNFVSSRKDRIEQARRDWKAGRFPKVVGDESDFIPLPE